MTRLLDAPVSNARPSPVLVDARRAEQELNLVLHADPGNADLNFALGILAYRDGRDDAALDAIGKAIGLDPSNPDFHYYHAVACLRLGRVDEARAAFERALGLRPEFAEAHHDLGRLHAGGGRFAEAEACYRRALALRPDLAACHYDLGVALANRGRLDEAAECYRQALRLRPDDADSARDLAQANSRRGQLDEAVANYRAALRGRPGDADMHNELGILLARQGRHDEAIASYREAIRLGPEFPDAHNNLGNALRHKGRHDEAIASLREALRLRPNYAEAHNNLAIALRQKGKHDEAVAAYHEALRLRPNYAEAHNNLGNSLRNTARFAESLDCYLKAIRLKPTYYDAHNNLGIAYAELGRFDDAIASYTECLKLRPTHVDAHLNRALTWLRKGDYAQGWAEYEWRWKKRSLTNRPLLQPQWNGFPIEGRRILLIAEQGHGDTFQFLRYARLLKARGATVIFECPEPLVKLLSRVPEIDQLIPRGQPIPDYDVYAPLLTLPGLMSTSVAAIPAEVPYLQADPDLVEHWRRELADVAEFKVGINWQGNPGYAGDRHRSIPLAHFAPLAKVPGVKLFSLQKNHGVEQLKGIEGKFPVIDLGGRLDGEHGPFMDTAAVMKNLDLFITSDTAVAHLAGALGVPVWMAISTTPDWRWMTDREDNPWYPTMRVFRQAEHMAWGPVFERIAAELRKAVPKSAVARSLAVPIAPGELVDKVTILRIKAERIADPEKLRHVRRELEALEAARERLDDGSEALARLTAELKEVNEALWEVEDALRELERAGDFGPRFVELARSVYHRNDRRAALKRQVNELLGSEIVEEKSYAPYAPAPAEAEPALT